MTRKPRLLFLILPFILSCAINYKIKPHGGALGKMPVYQDNVAVAGLSVSQKIDSTILFANARIKRQLFRKGYTCYRVTVSNSGNDSISLSAKNFYAISNYQPITCANADQAFKVINLNRGLFLAMSGYGLISPLAYAGRKLSFGKGGLIVGIPLLIYGATNAVIAYKSAGNLKKAIKAHYLLGKTVAPGQAVSGIILVKSQAQDLEFVFRK